MTGPTESLRSRGMRDLLPEEMGRFRRVEAVFRPTCGGWGFREIRTPVFAHQRELPQATTGEAPPTEGNWLPALFRYRRARQIIFHIARNGGVRPPKVADVRDFTGGETLDVPGHPRVVNAPGHSPGHVVLHVPHEGAVFVGDALCGWSTITGEQGPILPPREFNRSTPEAHASLDCIAELDADTVYFGHGDPWNAGMAAAVAEARSRSRVSAPG